MSQAIVQSQDCCNLCPDVPITQVPGPKGDPGTNGTDGVDGAPAFTTTTAGFTMPAVSGSVIVDVLDSTWMAPGQFIFVQGAGYFTVNFLPDDTSVSLTNLGYSVNAAPAAVIATAQKVSPGGVEGPAGSSGPTSTLDDLSPTNLKGDLLADTGANNPDADLVRFGADTDGKVLHCDSSQPAGLIWDKIDLADTDQITGVLPAANGGAGNILSAIFTFKQYVLSTMAAGNNSNVAMGDLTKAFIKITEPAASNFTITGIAGGADGFLLLLYNSTANSMTLTNEDALSTAGNRILTGTGSFITPVKWAILIYSTSDTRWLVPYFV